MGDQHAHPDTDRHPTAGRPVLGLGHGIGAAVCRHGKGTGLAAPQGSVADLGNRSGGQHVGRAGSPNAGTAAPRPLAIRQRHRNRFGAIGRRYRHIPGADDGDRGGRRDACRRSPHHGLDIVGDDVDRNRPGHADLASPPARRGPRKGRVGLVDQDLIRIAVTGEHDCRAAARIIGRGRDLIEGIASGNRRRSARYQDQVIGCAIGQPADRRAPRDRIALPIQDRVAIDVGCCAHTVGDRVAGAEQRARIEIEQFHRAGRVEMHPQQRIKACGGQNIRHPDAVIEELIGALGRIRGCAEHQHALIAEAAGFSRRGGVVKCRSAVTLHVDVIEESVDQTADRGMMVRAVDHRLPGGQPGIRAQKQRVDLGIGLRIEGAGQVGMSSPVQLMCPGTRVRHRPHDLLGLHREGPGQLGHAGGHIEPAGLDRSTRFDIGQIGIGGEVDRYGGPHTHAAPGCRGDAGGERMAIDIAERIDAQGPGRSDRARRRDKGLGGGFFDIDRHGAGHADRAVRRLSARRIIPRAAFGAG